MPEPSGERQDHFVFAIWIGLLIVLSSIAIDFQISSLARHPMPSTPSAGFGSGMTHLASLCGAYLLFRLVRPFSFTATGETLPQNLNYCIGVLLITLATAISATYLAWIVFYPLLFVRLHLTAGFVLPLATVAGFMFIEASLARSGGFKTAKLPYLDAGLLSALLIVPSLLFWFINVAPKSGIATSTTKMLASDMWQWLFPVTLTSVILVLWLVSSPLRRRCRQSPLYRSLVGALWIFGLTSFFIFAILNRHTGPTDNWFFEFFRDIRDMPYSSPASLVICVMLMWLLIASMLYAVQRKKVPQ